jgi:hypothetical protein
MDEDGLRQRAEKARQKREKAEPWPEVPEQPWPALLAPAAGPTTSLDCSSRRQYARSGAGLVGGD